MLKANLYAFFMLQSRVKNSERRIEPQGYIQVDTVAIILLGFCIVLKTIVALNFMRKED